MKILGLDTSNKFLIICLMKDNQVVAYHQERAFKNQSEKILPVMDQLFQQVGWKPVEIDQIVITDGPGSYTGVRIAMTIAKIMSTMRNIPLYTISSLLFYAGKNHHKVVLDARGGRAYFSEYQNGIVVQPDQIVLVDDLKEDFEKNSSEYLGDLNIFEQEEYYPDFKNNFVDLKEQWKLVEDVHHLKPNYLKDQEAYMVQK